MAFGKRKKNRTKLILPFFIIFLMIASVFGVMLGGISSDENHFKYNDLLFKIENNGRYSFSFNGGNYNLFHHPQEIENFTGEVDVGFFNDLSLGMYEKLYLDTSNKDSGQPNYEFYVNFGNMIDIVLSCVDDMKDEEHCLDLPIKSCDNKQEEAFFVKFSLDEEREEIVYDSDNGCLEVYGDKDSLMLTADYLVMKFLGVINE
jgi:hypothetical protein